MCLLFDGSHITVCLLFDGSHRVSGFALFLAADIEGFCQSLHD
jgi:hypothetical protein